MEADELAGMLRDWTDCVKFYADSPWYKELGPSETATANEETAFYVVLDNERFLVSVAKVGE